MTSSMAGEAPPTGLDHVPGAETEPLPATRPHPPREPWGLLSLLVVLGGISALAYYLGFVRPYLLQEYYLRPLLDLAKINGRTASAANAWALTWIVLFACYYIAFR